MAAQPTRRDRWLALGLLLAVIAVAYLVLVHPWLTRPLLAINADIAAVQERQQRVDAQLAQRGIGAADGAIVSYAGRGGVQPGIRQVTAQEDAEFRSTRRRRPLEALAGADLRLRFMLKLAAYGGLRAAEIAQVHGLDLVDGVPFDSAEYEWAFETQDHATACETVEAAALRCADISMNLGDLAAARHAICQGLRALPMNEPLYRARMRIEAASGNPDGVRRALGELTTALSASAPGIDPPPEPEPETRRVADALVSA